MELLTLVDSKNEESRRCVERGERNLSLKLLYILKGYKIVLENVDVCMHMHTSMNKCNL